VYVACAVGVLTLLHLFLLEAVWLPSLNRWCEPSEVGEPLLGDRSHQRHQGRGLRGPFRAFLRAVAGCGWVGGRIGGGVGAARHALVVSGSEHVAVVPQCRVPPPPPPLPAPVLLVVWTFPMMCTHRGSFRTSRTGTRGGEGWGVGGLPRGGGGLDAEGVRSGLSHVLLVLLCMPLDTGGVQRQQQQHEHYWGWGVKSCGVTESLQMHMCNAGSHTTVCCDFFRFGISTLTERPSALFNPYHPVAVLLV
jgi:hypothetical protein